MKDSVKSNQSIRKFLIRSFNDIEIEAFCFDYFPLVKNDFATSMPKSQKIISLIEWCERYNKRDELVEAIRRERDEQFKNAFDISETVERVKQINDSKSVRNYQQIFISHSYKDKAFANEIAEMLRGEGWEIWMAPDSINPGEKWLEAIRRGIATSGIFLILISRNSQNSNWVKDEINIAIALKNENKISLITALIDNTEISDPFIASYQYVDLRSFTMENLKKILVQIEAETRLPENFFGTNISTEEGINLPENPKSTFGLVYKTQVNKYKRLLLTEKTFIGRSEKGDVTLGSLEVERYHAIIEPRGKEWVLMDLNSDAGTKLNGKRLEGSIAYNLSKDDVITISSFDLFFREIYLVRGETSTKLNEIMENALQVDELIRQNVKSSLTNRQLQYLDAFASGVTKLEVSMRLDVKPSTVDAHLKSILALCRLEWGIPLAVGLGQKFLVSKFGDTHNLIEFSDHDQSTGAFL